jgi:hypothetical protein
MADDKYEAMDAYRIAQDDLPDGAFFQMAEDVHGWTVDDWMWFSQQYEARLKEVT